MCGIAGFNRAEGRSSIPNGRTFAIALAIGIEPRGRDATGFAWWEAEDDTNVWYTKQQGHATRVAPHAPLPKKGIRTLAAHTRYLTLGSAEDNNNNHPVVADGITCVHNGRVENHDELIELTGLERVGAVDSWAIPALLSKQAELGAGHPKELLELIHGVAAISWLDANDPDILHLARLSTRPLHIGWTKRGDLVFSSTQATMQKASKLAKVGIEDIIEVPEGTYMRVRNGAFEEWDSFKVNHPKVVAPDTDVVGYKPATKKGQHKPWPKAGKQQPTPNQNRQDYNHYRMPHIPQYTDGDLTGFDAWEDSVDWDQAVKPLKDTPYDSMVDLDWPPTEPSDEDLWDLIAGE